MAKRPTKTLAAALSNQPHDYAIVTIIQGRRYYWCRSQNKWSHWHDATHFSKNQRKAYTLPAGGSWITVLHGMGRDNYYAADTELAERK